MTTPIDKFQRWIDDDEDKHEFKERKNHFDFEKLVKYLSSPTSEAARWSSG